MYKVMTRGSREKVYSTTIYGLTFFKIQMQILNFMFVRIYQQCHSPFCIKGSLCGSFFFSTASIFKLNKICRWRNECWQEVHHDTHTAFLQESELGTPNCAMG